MNTFARLWPTMLLGGQMWLYSNIIIFTIQIKICAKYRDMLPMPKLVCQVYLKKTPKNSRGLGSMPRYSVQMLICFIAFIFQFAIPLWVWLATWCNCQHTQCTLPLPIVIKKRLLIRQSNLPACHAEVQQAEKTPWHLCHRTDGINR